LEWSGQGIDVGENVKGNSSTFFVFFIEQLRLSDVMMPHPPFKNVVWKWVKAK